MHRETDTFGQNDVRRSTRASISPSFYSHIPRAHFNATAPEDKYIEIPAEDEEAWREEDGERMPKGK